MNLFLDIETFTFNKELGQLRPSFFKGHEYSVAVGFYDLKNNLVVNHDFSTFNDFIKFLDENINAHARRTVNLIFHNGNRFDNHYLLSSLLNDFNLKQHNQYMRNVEDNDDSIKLKDLKKHQLLTKRVKSQSNLELIFKLNKAKIIYKTVDTIPKSNLSLREIGKTMNKLGILPKEYLKTTLDYQDYDLAKDLNNEQAIIYANYVHSKLSKDDLVYIDNDIIILAYFWKNYDKIFPGFDISKITFSQNVLHEYLINPLSNLQLLNRFGDSYLKYSEYKFAGLNLFDYLKRYYCGGLNFYNDKYLDKIYKHKMISYDLNSSYPNVMYNNKVPTYLIDADDHPHQIKFKFNDNYYELFEVSIDTFNGFLKRIKSTLIRKLITKYYTKHYATIFINTNTIRLINKFALKKIKAFNVLSSVKYECKYFGGRSVLKHNYAIKMQGKNNYKINAENPNKIKISKIPNEFVFSQSEINTSKVILNGLYGLPALRKAFNYFKVASDGELVNVRDGFKNTERNEIFSIFVTSVALYNLLSPLFDAPQELIDKYLLYGDTDSLYIDERLDKYTNHKLFNDYNLGFFKVEHHIDNFYILNHKKYAFHDYLDKHNEVRAGGIPLNSFNLDVPFDDFIKNQFSPGVQVPNLKSGVTESGVVVIRDSFTVLDKGSSYPELIDIDNIFKKSMAIEDIREKQQEDDKLNNVAYFETTDGSTISLSDLIQDLKPGFNDIYYLIEKYDIIKKKIS